MENKCLKCYEPIEDNTLYHKSCCQLLFNRETAPLFDVALADIEALAMETINKKLALTGVQRKISLSGALSAMGVHRLTVVGFHGDYILKPPSVEFPEMPELEDLTMSLAEIYGFDVARHGLVRLREGSLAYITRRFDRVSGRKIAMEDFCQLALKSTQEKYKGSSELIAKIIRQYASNFGEDLIRLYELLVFCFLTGNSDMHLKNFSLIRKAKGQVGLSPFYDLLATRLLLSEKQDPEELALPLNGKKSKLKREDFQIFAKSIGIPESVVSKIMIQFQHCAENFHNCIAKSFVSSDKKKEFHELLDLRLRRL
jgi:serine/threonine-protein kinase HipA